MKQQEYLNIKLWQHLQDDKQEHKKQIEQMRESMFEDLTEDDDLPF